MRNIKMANNNDLNNPFTVPHGEIDLNNIDLNNISKPAPIRRQRIQSEEPTTGTISFDPSRWISNGDDLLTYNPVRPSQSEIGRYQGDQGYTTVNLFINKKNEYIQLISEYGANSSVLLQKLNNLMENKKMALLTKTKIYLLKKEFGITQPSIENLKEVLLGSRDNSLTITKEVRGNSVAFFLDPIPSRGGGKKRRKTYKGRRKAIRQSKRRRTQRK